MKNPKVLSILFVTIFASGFVVGTFNRTEVRYTEKSIRVDNSCESKTCVASTIEARDVSSGKLVHIPKDVYLTAQCSIIDKVNWK